MVIVKGRGVDNLPLILNYPAVTNPFSNYNASLKLSHRPETEMSRLFTVVKNCVFNYRKKLSTTP